MELDFVIKVILPIVGAMVAILGLVIAIAKWRHDQTNVRKASAPSLEIFREEDRSKVTEIWLSNQGDGPATIISYELVVDGKDVYPCTSSEAYRLAFAQVGLDVRATLWITEAGKVIGKGTKINLVEIDPEDALHRRDEIRAKLGRIKFRFRYRSKFNDEFEVCR